jgi:hypothetical protein
MSLINTVYAMHLAELFGPNSTVTDVDYEAGICCFSLPLSESQDMIIPVTCSICGVYEGKIECTISDEQIEAGLATRKLLMLVGREINRQKKANESENNPLA